ncbi:MAG: polysaccharide deacetylase family protein [Planctomycetota bacterium]
MLADSPYGRRGAFVRLIYLFCAAVFFALSRTVQRTYRPEVVLCYHGIGPAATRKFLDQLAAIRRSQRRLHVTFDDSFANLLTTALPALRAAGRVPLVFVVAENLGRTPRWEMPAGHPDRQEVTMDVDQLRAAVRDNLLRVGSHTLTHRPLADLDESSICHELCESKRRLEALLDVTVEDLALPYGSYDERVLRLARAAGYRRIYTLDERLVDPRLMQSGVCGRFLVSPEMWPVEFALTCAGAYRWLFHWRRFLCTWARRLRSHDEPNGCTTSP